MTNGRNSNHLTERDCCVLRRAQNLDGAKSIRALRSQCQTEECKRQIEELAQDAERRANQGPDPGRGWSA